MKSLKSLLCFECSFKENLADTLLSMRIFTALLSLIEKSVDNQLTVTRRDKKTTFGQVGAAGKWLSGQVLSIRRGLYYNEDVTPTCASIPASTWLSSVSVS